MSGRRRTTVAGGLLLELVNHTRRPLDLRGVAALAVHVLCDEGVFRAEAGITFVGERRMRALNHEHRGQDGVTDVLSFPLEDADEQADRAPGDAAGPPRLLGDVVVCVRQAERQATRAGLPLSLELAVLVTHGLLHLLGWEHAEEPGAMALRQGELLAAFDWSQLG
jgi:probable rRNA maturation factor